MKRIEFIAPVEAMRGNLSGAQKLQYPTDNQGAYEGPVGSVNYARNYSPRFIGAKVAKSGKKYFAVRTKSANHLTTNSKKAMALLGGAGSIYAALLKNASLLNTARSLWIYAQEHGQTSATFRAYMMEFFRVGFVTDPTRTEFTATVASISLSVDNPWTKTGSLNVNVSSAIVSKFWDQLHKDGFIFTVDGLSARGVTGFAFGDMIDLPLINNLNLSKDSNDYIKMGSSWLIDAEGNYINTEDEPVRDQKFYTTAVAPA